MISTWAQHAYCLVVVLLLLLLVVVLLLLVVVLLLPPPPPPQGVAGWQAGRLAGWQGVRGRSMGRIVLSTYHPLDCRTSQVT